MGPVGNPRDHCMCLVLLSLGILSQHFLISPGLVDNSGHMWSWGHSMKSGRRQCQEKPLDLQGLHPGCSFFNITAEPSLWIGHVAVKFISWQTAISITKTVFNTAAAWRSNTFSFAGYLSRTMRQQWGRKERMTSSNLIIYFLLASATR